MEYGVWKMNDLCCGGGGAGQLTTNSTQLTRTCNSEQLFRMVLMLTLTSLLVPTLLGARGSSISFGGV